MRAEVIGTLRAHYERDREGRWVAYVEDTKRTPENKAIGSVRRRFRLPVSADAPESVAEAAFQRLVLRLTRERP